MIKVFLILTSAMLIATAIFGFLNRQSLIAESQKTQEANDKWKTANQELVQAEATLQDSQEELKAAKDDRDQSDAKLTLAREKLTQKERGVSELEMTLAEENLKLKEMNVVLEKFKDPATGEMPSIEKLRDQQAAKSEKLANTRAETETLRQQTVEVNKSSAALEAQIQGHIDKQKDRAASFIRNGFEATITAVNTDWGFVIIDAGKDKGVKADSPLLVSTQDGTRIGKLNIISIEPTVTVADIDQDSLATGVKIQPGHKVIYEDVSQ